MLELIVHCAQGLAICILAFIVTRLQKQIIRLEYGYCRSPIRTDIRVINNNTEMNDWLNNFDFINTHAVVMGELSDGPEIGTVMLKTGRSLWLRCSPWTRCQEGKND